ncbi:assimilatory sulfite reductase (NADPH) flavoprotein subunit [Colwellia sp. M166]|uniref:assimilatory sulfite reductase (NADPH) flavoprotein subunit n=1 Tax=Colwellia sp. M166 TaxID=2583805 RepID=UPI00211DDC6D|nr:assimilatory sulfite reductase (NADPH) flavoprotein subunit [Colwellia sp. M166]UUO24270.1 assimilatory sulfite reductase (NADPH) flavoprotein subunit [Colwellia sp. M166]|tara:strand:- start:62308 stop:64122 length:1815 start_codon:yes stop_codon:yes gene_type:complete
MLPEKQNLNQTMLDTNQLASFKQSINDLSPLQLAWASGYLAAKAEGGTSRAVATLETTTAVQTTLTILYGSQTGNAKGVAKSLAAKASAEGLTVELKSMGEIKPKAIKNITHLLIVASTNGEGEAPDDAIALHEFLSSKKAPSLEHLHYSVLALGDTSYEFFCQTGKDFDLYLDKLGAKRITPRVDCDVDYDADANTWSTTVIAQAKEMLESESATSNVVSLSNVVSTESQYTKQSPYAAELLVSQKITGRDSAKDVRHIEIDLAESGLTYQPGDALGVWFDNSASLVEELLLTLELNAQEKVAVTDESLTLVEALTTKFEITQTSINFVEFWANKSQAPELIALLSDKTALREFAGNHQVVDVVKSAPLATENTLTGQEFVDALRKITPRLYSIASSQSEVEEEVHLTVGLVQYQAGEANRQGGASGFLAHGVNEGGEVKVFIEHNDNFRLPADSNTPVIMIGPGTGVAPFRAFMQEREATEASGDNWLFFGDQTFTQDFLYQVEWQNYLKSGLLTKIDLAFSRDQADKIYVQDRLRENAIEVFSWLERGAHIYVCGDMSRMAKDVEATLLDIIATQGKLSEEQASAYLKDLRNAKRYQKDVY